MDNSPVMMEKPNDLTLEQCQEAFAMAKAQKVRQCLELIMRSQGLCHIREQIFGFLSYETLENCRKVSKLWKESLERIALIKCIEEFGDREVERQLTFYNLLLRDPKIEKVSTIFPGWKNAAQKYGVQASIEDLENVNDSLKKIVRGNGKCFEYPVHEAAIDGDVRLMEFILRTSYDMNTKDELGSTVWHLACINGQTETAQLIIQNSKEFGIDLNAKDNDGSTALHWACSNGQTETVQMILKNWKEFGVDIKAQDNQGQTALDLINHHQGGIWNQIKKMLEKEFSQIDVTEPVFCDQQWNFRVFCSPFLDFF